MKPKKIDQLFWYCKLGDIFKKLEGAHNGVHRWVGGGKVTLFSMTHAFIDYLWEKFRERQRSGECGGIDPGTDYPVFDETSPQPTKPEHMPDEEMDGMEFLKNRQGV